MLLAAVAAVCSVGVFGAGATAAASDFPVGYRDYHTYAELTTELHAIAAAHPAITSLSSIGRSYRGSQLWLLKISDNAAIDENEPEVLVTGLTHAREHLTVEQSLAFIHWLVDGYGSQPHVTSLVDSHEIWVIPMLNPDGGQYDIRGGHFHMWRKNRQPTPGSRAVGTDLNRNYGYRFGCCGGSSGNPSSLLYRGPHAFSAPETAAERAWMLSRRIGGVQQIRLELNLHTAGEYVLYPYAYTTAAVPHDMRLVDHQAFVALAAGIAARNGYRPMQSSSRYIMDGTANDWAYARQGILSMTLELAPTGGPRPFYPRDAQVGPDTQHNRAALLWWLAQAACPYAAAGLGCNVPLSPGQAPSSAGGVGAVPGNGLGRVVAGRSGDAFLAE